jgi:hypothetical protein
MAASATQAHRFAPTRNAGADAPTTEIAKLEVRFVMKASRQNHHKLQSILDLTC